VVDGVDSLKRLVVQFAELEPYELGTGKKKRVNTQLHFFRPFICVYRYYVLVMCQF